MAKQRQADSLRTAIAERMAELGISNPNALHRLVKEGGITRSHLYGYLNGEMDMGGRLLHVILEALDLVVVPRWRVLR